MIDPSYNVKKQKKLQNKLRQLLRDGFRIGLHGSLYSAFDKEILKKEKTILESIIGQKAVQIRQHWLSYKEKVTPYIQNKFFKFDSTLGWNDRIGFRAGCASQYNPYDHLNQKAFEFFEIPQVIMDSNIFDYNTDNILHAEDKAIKMLDEIKKMKNVYVSISWHQRVKNNDYRWHYLYEQILRII